MARARFNLAMPALGARQSPIFLLAILLGIVPCGARADNGWEGQLFSLTWENDAIAHSDRHYTQGAKISYFSKDNALPDWLQRLSGRLPASGFETKAQKYGVALGQEIYTPEDLKNSNLIPDDRPYAGWLFGSVALQRRGRASPRWLTMETFRLDLGVIGPESLAEETQKIWHGLDPQGWNHQLEAEPGVVLRYDRRYLFSGRAGDGGWGYHFIPSLSGSVGNVSTLLSAGSTLRLGYNIPDEFDVPDGPTPLRFGAYVFAGVDGRFVVRNVFLDGNTFRSSHSVHKKPLVADGRIGITLVLKMVELTASHVFRTREFNDQKTSDSFGSATLTFKF